MGQVVKVTEFDGNQVVDVSVVRMCSLDPSFRRRPVRFLDRDLQREVFTLSVLSDPNLDGVESILVLSGCDDGCDGSSPQCFNDCSNKLRNFRSNRDLIED